MRAFKEELSNETVDWLGVTLAIAMTLSKIHQLPGFEKTRSFNLFECQLSPLGAFCGLEEILRKAFTGELP